MGNSGGIVIVLIVGVVCFFAGYRYATRLVPDTGETVTRVVYRDKPVTPPDTFLIQVPVVREVYRTVTDTIRIAADRAFLQWSPAVTYVDSVSERLAVTRTRTGAVRIPYTYRGQTRIDTYAFSPAPWNVFLEVETVLMAKAIPTFEPVALSASATAWLRVKRTYVGVGVRSVVRDGEPTEFLPAVALRYRPWSLR